jgi:predicted metal-dependent peptidase
MTDGHVDLDKIAAAKLWLTATPDMSSATVGDAPYLSAAVYALITVPTDHVGEVAGDEQWRLYVNPTWLSAAAVPEVAAGIAHVAFHLLLDHADRARSMQVGRLEATSWEQAADSSVGDTSAAMSLPGSEALQLAAGREFSTDLSTEERYAMLSRLSVELVETDDLAAGHDESGCGSCVDGLERAYERLVSHDLCGLGRLEGDEIRRIVAIAYRGWQRDRTPGTTPGDWGRFSDRTLDPVVPWQQVLASAVRRAVAWTRGLTDYSYSRRSRRQSAVPSVVLPGMRSPRPSVAVIVDTSGSIDDGMLAQALGEVEGTLAAVGTPDNAIHLIAADAAVHTVQRIRQGAKIQLTGGGGTDMRVGIAAAADIKPDRPDVAIVLTDGDTPWPNEAPPGMVVVAALLGRHRAELPATPAWAVRVECVLT